MRLSRRGIAPLFPENVRKRLDGGGPFPQLRDATTRDRDDARAHV